jgi:sugar phosphate isomerase/epimerase
MNIAVQLYTLRDILPGHVESVLEKVASMGYQGVEFAGFYDIPSGEMKSLLTRLGLVAVSSHTGLEALEKHGEALLSYNKAIGNQMIVIPWSDIRDKASYQTVLPRIKKVVDLITSHHMIPVYHNHAHEFLSFDNKYILDHLLDDIPNLKLELDVYWAVVAGIDYKEYLIKRKDRLVLIHAKDMIEIHGDKTYGSVGEGMIDYLGLSKMGLNLPWWIVENDKPINPSLENIESSIKYIKKTILGGK